MVVKVGAGIDGGEGWWRRYGDSVVRVIVVAVILVSNIDKCALDTIYIYSYVMI